jgi:small-conductance mechanosensitive channel
MDTPAPGVRFIAFGANGLEFELRTWTTTLVHRRGKFTSEINFAIYDKFKEHGIDVPNPQRDVHIRSGTIDLGPGTNQSDHGKMPNS